MRARLLALLALATATSVTSAQERGSLAITHVTVIDMTGAAPQSDMTVVVTGNRISAIHKTAKAPPREGAREVNAEGKFLIPGLWDMHVHSLWEPYTETFFPLFLANGVTGIRDMHGQLELGDRLRRQIQDGELLGPRIVAAGPIVDGPNPVWPGSISVASPVEARRAVQDLKQRGADFIKLYNGLSPDSYFALADECGKQNLRFAGHIPDGVTASEAAAAGQASLEHLLGFLLNFSTREAELRKETIAVSEAWKKPEEREALLPRRRALRRQLLDTFSREKAEAVFAEFVKNGTWQVPTLTVLRPRSYSATVDLLADPRITYLPSALRRFWTPAANSSLGDRTPEDSALREREFKKHLELVGAMHRAGVKLMAGTDVFNPTAFPGFAVAEELELLVQAELTPMQALQAATRNPAEFLGKLDDLGTLEVGKAADMVLLDADPLTDISNTRKIRAVWVNGRFLDRKELDRLLALAESTAAKQN